MSYSKVVDLCKSKALDLALDSVMDGAYSAALSEVISLAALDCGLAIHKCYAKRHFKSRDDVLRYSKTGVLMVRLLPE